MSHAVHLTGLTEK